MPTRFASRRLALWAAIALLIWLPHQRASVRMVTRTSWVLYLEAEQGQVVAPLLRIDDVLVSGCAYLTTEERESGSVTLTFSVPAEGSYYAWARVMGLSLTNNSFYFGVDGGVESKYEFLPFHGVWTWGWARVHAEKQAETAPLALTAGAHTLTFRGREPEARLDAVVITDAPDYVPLGIAPCALAPSATPTAGAATPSSTPSPDPRATATPFVVQMEAEQGGLTAPMERAENPLASACGYVHTLQRDAGAVTFTFSVPASGAYYPWARVMGLSLMENSFFFSVDGSAPAWYEIPPFHGAWTWIWHRVHVDGEQPYTTSLMLSAGVHQIVFAGREPEARLDAIVITDDPDYDPLFQPGSSSPCLLPPNATATSSPMPSPSATSTPTPTHTPTATASPPPTSSRTPFPSVTPTVTPSSTPTPSPAASLSATPEATPATPTCTPSLTPTPVRLNLPLAVVGRGG